MILLTFSNVEAAEDENPFELIVDTHSGREMLALVKSKADGELFFMVAARNFDSTGFIPYERRVYDFYLNQDQTGGCLTTTMILPGQTRGQVDDDLGEWQGNVHLLPIVYARFKVENGQVICKKPFYSASGIDPSHYQTKIRNIDHTQLIEILMTHMPRLHEAVQAKGITLP